MSARRKTKPAVTLPRPFTTDYAGAWQGHCKTRESAIRAAVRHILEDGYVACTITNGADYVARVRVGDNRRSVNITMESPLRQLVKLRSVK